MSIVNPDEPIDYAGLTTPSSYTCGECGRAGVKLWRDYEITLHHQSLLCADCTAKAQRKDISSMGQDGIWTSDQVSTDQIGWRVPAVPTAANDGFWGYTSVPDDACAWWKRLPLR